MPNRKYARTLYVGFLACHPSYPVNQQDRFQGSCYTRKDINDYQYPRHDYLFDFTSDKTRQAIETERPMEMLRIDFALDGNIDRFPTASLNIEPQGRTNKEIASAELTAFLGTRVVPHTKIYIDIHGAEPQDGQDPVFIQSVLKRDKSTQYCEITASYMAQLLSNAITHAKCNNITIHLLSCYSSAMAPNLMSNLHNLGFKRTIVIGYKGVVLVGYNALGSISDFSTEDRKYKDNPFRHGIRGMDENKIASHNLNGPVITEAYHPFKKREISRSLNKLTDTPEGLTVSEELKIEEFLYIIMILELCINDYISNSTALNHNSLHLRHKHGNSGRERAALFLMSLGNMKVRHVANEQDPNALSRKNLEKELIQEIKLFSTKGAHYADFSGSININNNSCFSYIEQGIILFFTHCNFNPSSTILTNFLNAIIPRNIRHTSIHNNFLESQSKLIRLEIKNNINTLTVARIEGW
ncbi:MAG: hypothetical protein ACJA0H_000548 [Francisellaceae bacterium]|jgi:hypothetical protein